MSVETQTLVYSLAQLLTQRKALLTTAESCTGGLIAKNLTDISGSSNWFDRGFVSYSNQAKVEMLGVQEQTLLQHGAVSEAVAREMAQGAIHHSDAEYALAVTGIAGPSGGTAEKPVGTVWFGFAAAGQLVSEHKLFNGNREQIRILAAHHALQCLWDMLNTK